MDLFEYLYLSMRDRQSKRSPEIPLRRLTYFEQLMTVRVSMFEWKAPASVNPVWLERYLATTGSVLAGQKDGEIKITSLPARYGDLDQYGDGEDGLGIPRNGDPEIEGKIGNTVGICYNNSMRAPDLDLLYYPEIMSQIDKSVQEIIEQCRIAPLLCADNSVAKQEIENILGQLRDGEPKVITSDTTLRSLQRLRESQGVFGIHLVDPDLTHNAQYLAELWDVMLRRFCNNLGIDTRKTTKHAQVSTAEATGMSSVSWIIPFDMLRNRKQFCELMQQITGDEWSVDFSEAWLMELDRYKAEIKMMEVESNDTGNTDGDPDGSEDVGGISGGNDQ